MRKSSPKGLKLTTVIFAVFVMTVSAILSSKIKLLTIVLSIIINEALYS